MCESAADFYWYHEIDLPTGEKTVGDFDIRDILPHFHLPERMDGLTVLDVGRGSGAFSFEFERRGAEVTALDLYSFLDWDFVGGRPQREKMRTEIGDERAFSKRHIHGAFDYAHKALESKVRPIFMNAYSLAPERFVGGQTFDIVFAGSITSHLRDPMLAFERMKSVTKKLLIVSAPTFSIPGTEDAPLMCLVTGDADRRSWWVINSRGLVEMLQAASFSSVEIKSEFLLKNKRLGTSYSHLVAHALV